MDSINKKISQFSPVDTLHTPTARIPLVQGTPLFDAIITPEDLSKGLEQFYNNVYLTVSGENSNLDILKFNTQGTGGLLAGQMAWNPTEGTLDVGMNGGDVMQSLGLELFVRYKPTESITNGDLLMYDGTDGNSGVVKLKRATVNCNPDLIYAIATEDAQVGGLHFATWYGKIRGLNTSGYVAGQELYQSTTLNGKLQTTTPPAPYNKSSYAKVINSHSTVGTIFVRVQHSAKLGDLNDLDVENAQQYLPLVLTSDGVWRESDTVHINTIQPSTGTLTVDGSLQTDNLFVNQLQATSLSVIDDITSTGMVEGSGFIKTGTTGEDLLTGDGGSITKETLRSTITSLRHPSTPGTKVVEVNSSGQVLINGTIIQNGEAYRIDAEEVTTKEEVITLRSGSVLGLPTGETSGLKIQNYDGTTDGYIVIDGGGVLRIGDSGSLQPVMTREETPTSYSPLYFNPVTLRGETLPGTTVKSTLVDGDAVIIKDSADSNKPKWWSFSNIKSNLKSYFDTLYMTLTGNQTVAGVKTFSSSPLVPTPTTNFQAATKQYADGVGNTTMTTALLAASQSLQNAELAQKWASNPEDVVVSGSLYSSKHYMEKSKDIKDYLQSIFDQMYVMPDAYFSGSL